MADYTRAIEIDPNFADAYNNRSVLYWGRGDADRTLADLDKAIELNPKQAVSLGNRGHIHRAKGDLDRALVEYTNAIAADPKYSAIYTARGIVFRAKGDLQRALTDFATAIETATAAIGASRGNADAYVSRCWARAIADKDLPLGLADCDEALRINPRTAKALRTRAFLFGRLGRFDEATADYDAALAIGSSNAEALYGRGFSRLGKGDQSGGDADIARALSIQPWLANEYDRYNLK